MFGTSREGSNLEILQRDSWQLELLVTGFALAGMISGLEEFRDWNSRTLAALNGNGILTVFAGGLILCVYFAYLITLANFFFHVVLRCLWIGAIGSRSVMRTTVLHRRKLAPRFVNFLARRSGDIDAYIRRLDDTASLVFAFTFLLIIVAVSLLTTSVVLVLFGFLIQEFNRQLWLVVVIGLFITVFMIAGLLYLIDFLTVGWLKRFRWLSVVYYPFYRLFGWITLARVYRPLYYNLLNQRRGRTVVLLLIPYLCLAIFILSLSISPNAYVAEDWLEEDDTSAYTLDPNHYEDENQDDSPYTEIVIPSQIVHTSPLRVRLPILGIYESYIERACPDLRRHYSGSLHSGLFDSRERFASGAEPSLDRDVLACLSAPLKLFVDGSEIGLQDVLLTRPQRSNYSELIKFIPLDSLPAGLHELTLHQLKRPSSRAPEDSLRSVVTVPFYYAPVR